MTTSEEFALDFSAGNIKRAMRAAEAPSRDLYYVPYEKLAVIDGFNVRTRDAEYEADVRQYAESMMLNGYDPSKPICGFVTIFNGVEVIAITDGHRRYEAAGRAREMGAPLDQLPVVVRPGSTSMEDLTVSLVAANSGKPLKPYELSLVCKRLVGYGWTPDAIAEKLTLSRAYVDQLLAILALPRRVRDQVRDGIVSFGLAIKLAKKHGDGAADVIEAAANGGSKATAKRVADPVERFARREAPKMYAALRAIHEDPAFSQLGEVARGMWMEIFDRIPSGESK
jgi:ParB family chromosome partitioning protein